MAKKTLREYISSLGDEAAAKRLGVSLRAVQSWRYGDRSPRTKDIPRLIELSGGELTYGSFFETRAA